MITLRQLEIFVTVVREGSFRKCGDRLGISQVVVSEHVRALEDRLGRSLFDRRVGGPAILTDVGRRAERGASAILASIGDFLQEMAGDDRRRVVTIAVHPFLMRNRQDLILAARAAFPQIDLRIHLDDHSIAELNARVERRELDLAIFFTLDDADAPQAEFMYHEKLAVYVGPNDPLARKAVVRADDLRAMPVIHLSRRKPLRLLIERALDTVGAGGGEIAMETDEFGLILSSVHRGLGFVCMFDATQDEAGQTFGLQRVSLQKPLPQLQVRVASRPAAGHDPALRALKAIFSAGVAQYHP